MLCRESLAEEKGQLHFNAAPVFISSRPVRGFLLLQLGGTVWISIVPKQLSRNFLSMSKI